MTGGPTPLRIVVADDQASVREGLVALLGLLPDIDVVASAANGEQAIRAVADTHPDAILLDLHMPVLDGIEATRRLAAEHPRVAIVVLTTYDDDASVLAALQAGARSYLTKAADRAEIAQALRSAVAGLAVLDPAIHAKLLQVIKRVASSTRDPYGQGNGVALTSRWDHHLSALTIRQHYRFNWFQLCKRPLAPVQVDHRVGQPADHVERTLWSIVSLPTLSVLDENLPRAVHPDLRDTRYIQKPSDSGLLKQAPNGDGLVILQRDTHCTPRPPLDEDIDTSSYCPLKSISRATKMLINTPWLA